VSEKKIAVLADFQFVTASCGDWNVVGWRHPMAQKYEIRAVILERDGAKKGFAVVTPTFGCEVHRDVHGMDVELRPNIVSGTAAWRIEAVGTEGNNIAILSLERVDSTYQPLKTLHIVDLEIAFSRLIRQ
jgi:hypothetical protein